MKLEVTPAQYLSCTFEPQVDIENYYKIPVAKQEFWVLLSKICILFRRSLYNIT